jgi:secreted trypsin-like serine protease
MQLLLSTLLIAAVIISVYSQVSDFPLACGKNTAPPRGSRVENIVNIVGGTEAVAYGWPWQVLVTRNFYGKSLRCGASVITKRWMLSAAHCFFDAYGRRLKERELSYHVGRHSKDQVDKGSQSFTSIKVIVHEKYDHLSNYNDIALILVDRDIIFSKTVQPVCLPEEDALPGDNCVVTGWGSTRGSYGQGRGESQDRLRQVTLPIVSQEICARSYKTHRNGQTLAGNMMCAGYAEGGKDSCAGDSGGPLVCKRDTKWFQAGIVSSGGLVCAEKNNYGIYTRVAKFRDWIMSTIKNGKKLLLPINNNKITN